MPWFDSLQYWHGTAVAAEDCYEQGFEVFGWTKRSQLLSLTSISAIIQITSVATEGNRLRQLYNYSKASFQFSCYRNHGNCLTFFHILTRYRVYRSYRMTHTKSREKSHVIRFSERNHVDWYVFQRVQRSVSRTMSKCRSSSLSPLMPGEPWCWWLPFGESHQE